MSATSRLVVLRDGTTVPLSALQLAWRLEDQGLRLGVTDGRLTVGPKTAISQTDDALIRQHRDALMALVVYTEHITA